MKQLLPHAVEAAACIQTFPGASAEDHDEYLSMFAEEFDLDLEVFRSEVLQHLLRRDLPDLYDWMTASLKQFRENVDVV